MFGVRVTTPNNNPAVDLYTLVQQVRLFPEVSTPLTASTLTGSNAVEVASTEGLTPNDPILIAGREFRIFQVVDSNNLTLTTNVEADLILGSLLNFHPSYEELLSYALAATQVAENYLNRKLLTQGLTLTLDSFSDPLELLDHEVYLPYAANFQQLDSVSYRGESGDQDYPDSFGISELVVSQAELAKVRAKTTFPTNYGLEIAYTCGYGDDPSAIPQSLKIGLARLTSEMFEGLCGDCEGASGLTKKLLHPYRILI